MVGSIVLIVKEMGLMDVEWINLALDRDRDKQRQSLKLVVNLGFQ